VVVDEVEHLDGTAALQGDVGDVHLPALVRQVRFEADIGASGPLVRLGRDEATPGEDPPDGRDRAGRDAVVVAGEVGVDRVGPCIGAELDELLSQSDDLVFHGVGEARG
jgi:hypothetical protein